jgi:hypothetical protein
MLKARGKVTYLGFCKMRKLFLFEKFFSTVGSPHCKVLALSEKAMRGQLSGAGGELDCGKQF